MLLSLLSFVLYVAEGDPSTQDPEDRFLGAERMADREDIARTLAIQWPESRAAIEAIFAGGGPEAARAFWAALFTPWSTSRGEDLSRERKRSIASEFARHHTDPRIRALSLSCAILRDRKAAADRYDVDLLRQVYASEGSPLVRIAILRLASFIGQVPGGVDLRERLLEEKDPAILLNAIQARSVSMCRLSNVAGLELWGGFLISLRPPLYRESGRGGCLDAGEMARLDRILAHEKEPLLRDAASRALALDRAWNLRGSQEKLPIETRADLRIHEWGVWFDRGAVLRAAHEAEDLPPFVHRSRTAAADIWSAHSYSPMFVTKPVVHFYCPEPIILILRAHFYCGRPWSFFPEITDYIESVKGRSGFLWNRRRTGDARPFPGPRPFEDRPGLRPPWAGDAHPEMRLPWQRDLMPEFLLYGTPAEELRRYSTIAPWVFPAHDVIARRTGSGDRILAGIGVEWRGLRVGFPADLEAAPPEAPAGHWWQFLRDVPSAPVAIGGESERFLFYDGSIDAPGPIEVRWTTVGKKALRIRVRPFESYPSRDAWLPGWPHWSFPAKEGARSPVPAVFIVRVEEGEDPAGVIWEVLSPSDPPRDLPLATLFPIAGGVEAALEKTLVSQGLTEPETKALLRTWREEFFRKPGLRAITVLPQWLYDALLPLEIDPIPGETVRAGIIVRECDDLLVDSMDAVIAPVSGGCDPLAIREGPLEVRTHPVAMAIDQGVSLPPEGPVPRQLTDLATEASLSGDGNVLLVIDRTGKELQVFDLRSRSRSKVFLPDDAPRWYAGGSPSLSRDGRRIAFETERRPIVLLRGSEPRSGIAVIDMASSRIHVLIAEDIGHRSPSLSADGRLLAFAASGGGKRAVAVADLETRRVRSFDPGGEPVDVVISGDGNTLAYSARGDDDLDLFAADLRTGTRRVISDRPGDDQMPSISSDGIRVAFAGEVSGDREILLADLGAGTIRDISRREGKDDFPRISADGRRIVFSGLVAEDRHIFVADLENGSVDDLSRLTSWDYGPSIAGDGRTVIFLSVHGFFAIVQFARVE
ncbi:MAG: PD40 domain-containing protein [Planctomycetes bacterium]|nr:PD40 domain-containing protein [Planctomycetota bacterium]